jgi:hypothetical protein
MLTRIMQKKAQTIAEQINSIFTTQVLVSIIGCLLGILAIRLVGG